jgi:hypothetical protein
METYNKIKELLNDSKKRIEKSLEINQSILDDIKKIKQENKKS